MHACGRQDDMHTDPSLCTQYAYKDSITKAIQTQGIAFGLFRVKMQTAGIFACCVHTYFVYYGY